MRPYDIIEYGNPILRAENAHVVSYDDEIRQTARKMLLTMYEEPGVGFAAPQAGINLKLVVIDAGDGPWIFVNPRIFSHGAEKETEEEGCLSFPDIRGEVERTIEIEYAADIVFFNGEPDGEPGQIRKASGLQARILQHEIDHIDGILFIDRMYPEVRIQIRGQLDKLKRRTRKRIRNAG